MGTGLWGRWDRESRDLVGEGQPKWSVYEKPFSLNITLEKEEKTRHETMESQRRSKHPEMVHKKYEEIPRQKYELTLETVVHWRSLVLDQTVRQWLLSWNSRERSFLLLFTMFSSEYLLLLVISLQCTPVSVYWETGMFHVALVVVLGTQLHIWVLALGLDFMLNKCL